MRRSRADWNVSISVTSGEKKKTFFNNNIISAKSDFCLNVLLGFEATIETLVTNLLSVVIFRVGSCPQKPDKLKKKLFSVVPGGAGITPSKSDSYRKRDRSRRFSSIIVFERSVPGCV